MTGVECEAIVTPQAAFVPNTTGQPCTVKNEKKLQDRRKTTGFRPNYLQDTQKKTKLQWQTRPSYRRYTGFYAQYGVIGLLFSGTAVHAAPVGQIEQQPTNGQGVADSALADLPTTASHLTDNTPIFSAQNAVLSAQTTTTENYNQQIEMPQLVIEYQDIAYDIWSSQLFLMLYCFLAAFIVLGLLAYKQRHLNLSLIGLVMIFAFGFALLIVRVKLTA